MKQQKGNECKPKNGRERQRRSMVVYTETINKIKYIAAASGIEFAELTEAIFAQAVEEWEQANGKITIATNPVNITAINKAIEAAKGAPTTKRGRPKKNSKNE